MSLLLEEIIIRYNIYKEHGKGIRNVIVESCLCSTGDMAFEWSPEAKERVMDGGEGYLSYRRMYPWLLRTTSCKSGIVYRETGPCEPQKVSIVVISYRIDFGVSLQPFPVENRSASARHMEITGNKSKEGQFLFHF